MFDLLEAQELTNSSTHKNMVKTMKKRSKMLVESINQINPTNLVLQDKQTKTQKKKKSLKNNSNISKPKLTALVMRWLEPSTI
jgi:hypothetical protein